MGIDERLKIWRKHLGLSQAAFSQLTGIPLRTFKGYEANARQPGSEALAAITSTGVNANWLLTGEGDMLQPAETEQRQLSPEQLSEFNREFTHIFDLLLLIEDEKRKEAINEMLSRVREAARINEMERKLKELESKEK